MIRRLYVNNFRCLENFDFKISENPSSLLLGKNGAGKSTVSFALEVFQTIARGTNRVSELVKPSDLSHGRAEVPMRFIIEAQIDDASFEYHLALELPKGFRELRVFEEKLMMDNNVVFFPRQVSGAINQKQPEQGSELLSGLAFSRPSNYSGNV